VLVRTLTGRALGLVAAFLIIVPEAVRAATTVSSTMTSVTSTTVSGIAGSLPQQLLPYASIVGIMLAFVDGLIFGVAIKKAITSAILIIAGFLLAGFIGLTIPFLSTSSITTHLLNIFISQARLIGPAIYALPIFWIIGFAIGIWRG
jgi:hypothetical protein